MQDYIAAIDAYAAGMVKHHANYRPQANAAELATIEANARERAKEQIEGIRTKSAAYIAGVYQGRLHPDNKQSRALFEAVTGLKLPGTVKGTWEAVKAYAGPEIDAYEAARDAERQAEQAAADAKAEAERAAWFATVAERVRNDQPISGADLCEACRELSIEVHPRTAGMIRESWLSVNTTEGARKPGRNGKASHTNTPFRLYQQCKAVIENRDCAKDIGAEYTGKGGPPNFLKIA
jgi:hypothetical protein